MLGAGVLWAGNQWIQEYIRTEVARQVVTQRLVMVTVRSPASRLPSASAPRQPLLLDRTVENMRIQDAARAAAAREYQRQQCGYSLG